MALSGAGEAAGSCSQSLDILAHWMMQREDVGFGES